MAIIAWPPLLLAEVPPAKAIGVEAIRAADHVGQSRYALVVGIDRYTDRHIPDLTTCTNDARAVYELLTDPRIGGVSEPNATLLLNENATANNIRRELARLRLVPADSTVFIYFSGHGAKEGDEAYWVTHDAELDLLAASGLPDRDVRAFLGRIPAERIVVMIDACYAAATVKGGKAIAADFANVLERFTGQGHAYLMAAGSGEEAIEAHDLARSVFTHYLVEGLRGAADADRDGVVTLNELTRYVDQHVADEARIRGGIQRPVVRMDNVVEPSRFALTIDAERLRRHMLETEAQRQLRQQRLAKLRELYLEEDVTLDHYQLGRRLLHTAPDELDAIEQHQRREFATMLDGELRPDRLQRALDAIEATKQQHAKREREAEERDEVPRAQSGDESAALDQPASSRDTSLRSRIVVAAQVSSEQIDELAPGRRASLTGQTVEALLTAALRETLRSEPELVVVNWSDVVQEDGEALPISADLRRRFFAATDAERLIVASVEHLASQRRQARAYGVHTDHTETNISIRVRTFDVATADVIRDQSLRGRAVVPTRRFLQMSPAAVAERVIGNAFDDVDSERFLARKTESAASEGQ